MESKGCNSMYGSTWHWHSNSPIGCGDSKKAPRCTKEKASVWARDRTTERGGRGREWSRGESLRAAVLTDFHEGTSATKTAEKKQHTRRQHASTGTAHTRTHTHARTQTHTQAFTACELELSKLEHEYGIQTYEARKRHERALGKLRGEIDLLDKRRLKLLRKRPSIVERVLHRSSMKLEQSTSALQSKRTDFGHKGTLLQHELDELRANYEVKRGHLRERQQLLRAKLAEFNRNTSNDALEVRNAACQELSRTVAQAVDRSSKTQLAADAKNTQ